LHEMEEGKEGRRGNQGAVTVTGKKLKRRKQKIPNSKSREDPVGRRKDKGGCFRARSVEEFFKGVCGENPSILQGQRLLQGRKKGKKHRKKKSAKNEKRRQRGGRRGNPA